MSNSAKDTLTVNEIVHHPRRKLTDRDLLQTIKLTFNGDHGTAQTAMGILSSELEISVSSLTAERRAKLESWLSKDIRRAKFEAGAEKYVNYLLRS